MARRYKWDDCEDQKIPHVFLDISADLKHEMLLCPCGYKFFDVPHLDACPKCQGDIVFPRADW